MRTFIQHPSLIKTPLLYHSHIGDRCLLHSSFDIVVISARMRLVPHLRLWPDQIPDLYSQVKGVHSSKLRVGRNVRKAVLEPGADEQAKWVFIACA